MRWLFVGIVLLNVLYFGWNLAASDELAQGPQADPGANSSYSAPIQLLGEVKAEPLMSAGAALGTGGCPAIAVPDDGLAREVVERLEAQGLGAEVEVSAPRIVPVYWVYIPSLGTRQAAVRKLRELQAKGIDSFVVAEGADSNAVSLGIFANRDSAFGVLSRLRSAGYDVSVREQSREVRQAWILLKNPAAQGYMEALPTSLQASAQVDRRPCPQGR